MEKASKWLEEDWERLEEASMRWVRRLKHLEKTSKRRKEASRRLERLPKDRVTADERSEMLWKWHERPFNRIEAALRPPERVELAPYRDGSG